MHAALRTFLASCQTLPGLRADETGATGVEYGLIAALIVLAMLGGLKALGVDLAAQQFAETEIEHEPPDGQIRGAGALLRIGDDGVADNDLGAWREQDRGGAVDLKVPPGLLLDARGDPVAHPIGGDQQIDEQQREQRGADHGRPGDDEDPGAAGHRRQREAPGLRRGVRRRRMRLLGRARRLGGLMALHGRSSRSLARELR